MTRATLPQLAYALGMVEGLLRQLPPISVVYSVQMQLGDGWTRHREDTFSLRLAGISATCDAADPDCIAVALRNWLTAARERLGWEMCRD
jgi:hypothetical protein